ncbi:hypothetical protein [Thermococcus camini]|uniref:Uncharacterized protein n=1 Tax=Thermococcus camini TaxID=2016373 RepID=A0A7G2D999_9EURY|nr:hypothetical protein [Thermococcus camini]CAD5244219.1 conserved membrane protein of unknown function [Thermococcus camini]
MSATVNPWIGVFVVLGIPLLIYLYSRRRMSAPKAGLMAVALYLLLGLALIARGWNISPWTIILPGLFVAFLDVLQLRQRP